MGGSPRTLVCPRYAKTTLPCPWIIFLILPRLLMAPVCISYRCAGIWIVFSSKWFGIHRWSLEKSSWICLGSWRGYWYSPTTILYSTNRFKRKPWSGFNRIDASWRFFWNTMKSDVELFVRACIHCLSTTGGGKLPRPFGPAVHEAVPKYLIQFYYI